MCDLKGQELFKRIGTILRNKTSGGENRQKRKGGAPFDIYMVKGNPRKGDKM